VTFFGTNVPELQTKQKSWSPAPQQPRQPIVNRTNTRSSVKLRAKISDTPYRLVCSAVGMSKESGVSCVIDPPVVIGSSESCEPATRGRRMYHILSRGFCFKRFRAQESSHENIGVSSGRSLPRCFVTDMFSADKPTWHDVALTWRAYVSVLDHR
jgi:hypothetical protein